MATWIIGGFVVLAAAMAVRSIYKDKKAGKCSCGCSGWQRLQCSLSLQPSDQHLRVEGEGG